MMYTPGGPVRPPINGKYHGRGQWYTGKCPNMACTRGNATSNPPILGNQSKCYCGIGCDPSVCYVPSREAVFDAFEDQAQELVPFVVNGTISGIFFGTGVTVIFNLLVNDDQLPQRCTLRALRMWQRCPPALPHRCTSYSQSEWNCVLVPRAAVLGDELSCTTNVPFATVDEGTRKFRKVLTTALEAHTPGLSKRVFYATNECQNTLGCAPPPHTCPGCTPGCGVKNGEYHPWCVAPGWLTGGAHAPHRYTFVIHLH